MAEANSAAIVVLLTAGSQEEASRLAEMLVGAHLAACVQILPQMESVYRWKGEVHRAPEFLLLAKTTAACFDELFEALTLIQTRKIKNFPVVLFGSEYWGGMMRWLSDVILKAKNVVGEDVRLLRVTDSPSEVVDIVVSSQDALRKMNPASDDY